MKTLFGKEPAVLVGALITAVTVLANLFFGAAFDDGVSLAEASYVLAPLAAAFGIRLGVDSPATVRAKVARAKRRR